MLPFYFYHYIPRLIFCQSHLRILSHFVSFNVILIILPLNSPKEIIHFAHFIILSA